MKILNETEEREYLQELLEEAEREWDKLSSHDYWEIQLNMIRSTPITDLTDITDKMIEYFREKSQERSDTGEAIRTLGTGFSVLPHHKKKWLHNVMIRAFSHRHKTLTAE